MPDLNFVNNGSRAWDYWLDEIFVLLRSKYGHCFGQPNAIYLS